jgi:flagellar biosynthesis/type III secretory pathway protein FliH
MSRLLRQAVLHEVDRPLGEPTDHPLGRITPEFQALLDRHLAEAYEAGRRDGQQEGWDAACGELDRLALAITTAFARSVPEHAAVREADTSATAALALEIAAAVVGHEPHDDGHALAARVAVALADVDDGQLVVRVNPDDAVVVEAALRRAPDVPHGLTVEPDATLAPGEARVVGRWADVDVTRAAAWAAVEAVLAP